MSTPTDKGDSVVMGVSEDLLARAKEVAREIRKQGAHTLPIDLFGEGDKKHQGLVSNTNSALIVIGTFIQEGVQFYIGLPKE